MYLEVHMKTVDGFQGRENTQAVVISLVRSNEKSK